MDIDITTIVYKRNYGDKWKPGILIRQWKDINKDGSLNPDRYFSLEIDSVGHLVLKPFKYSEMNEIGYQNFYKTDI